MKNPSIVCLFALLIGFPCIADTQEDTEVLVNVLGKGAGKFQQANITREENRVIQAAFDGASGNALNALIQAPDGSVYLAGSSSAPLPMEAQTPEKGGVAFVARLTPDLRTMEALLRLPQEFQDATCLDVGPDGTVLVAGKDSKSGLRVARLSSGLERLIWSKEVVGDHAVSVSAAPDNSVVVCPAEVPFVSRVSADGSRLIPFGANPMFRTDAGNPDIHRAWWEGLGYPAAGYKGGATYHRGGSAGVRALKDGSFVLFTTNFLHHPGGGPDFDPMLVKFDGEGKILWCTNLLEGLPAESDHKQPHMAVDPFTGDLLLSAIQHGHFSKNLISSPGAYLKTDAWFTGNIMIGWIARVNPDNGVPKAATFYFPEMPGPIQNGKRRANSLFPKAPAVDAEGNIYVTGATAWKLPTTIHAFQSEPLGGSGFLSIFSPDLSRLIYSSLLTSKGYKFTGKAVIATPGGPGVIGSFEKEKTGPYDFVTANSEVTNYLAPSPPGDSGGVVGFYPSGPWQD